MTDDGWEPEPTDRPMVMQRLRRMAGPVAVVLAAVMVVFLSYQGPMLGAVAAFVATIVVVLWLRNRPTDDERGGYGPGADGGVDRTE